MQRHFFWDGPSLIRTDLAEPAEVVISQNGKVIPFRFQPAEEGGEIILEEDLSLETLPNVACNGSPVTLTLRFITHDPLFEETFLPDLSLLGSFYRPEGTLFRVYAPLAEKAEVEVEGEVTPLADCGQGVFAGFVAGDLEGKSYHYRVTRYHETKEVLDPFAYSSLLDSAASVIIDERKIHYLKRTLPALPKEDVILYELSVRDFSASRSWPGRSRRRFAALQEEDLQLQGLPVGIDYLRSLGVTHLQFLPLTDFATVDEKYALHYNWGYDPVQYNVIEGSYLTDQEDPYARILEWADTVRYLHERGLRVTMDVVFNHVYDKTPFALDELLPYAFFRYQGTKRSNGAFCGNELRTESLFLRAYIVAMCRRYVELFDIDGLRFDLMGLIDIDTMKEIAATIEEIKPGFLIYGEGWSMPGALPEEACTTLNNAKEMPSFSFFNDRFRNILRGEEGGANRFGFAMGDLHDEEQVYEALRGSCSELFDSPLQSLNYLECHDNRTYADKLQLLSPEDDEERRKEKVKLALGFLLLSEGIPFLHAGQEFLRSKNGEENSYRSPDRINALDWRLRVHNDDVVNYTRELIALRKEYPELRLKTKEECEEIAFSRYYEMVVMEVGRLLILFNPCSFTHIYPLERPMELVFQEERCSIRTDLVEISPFSLAVLRK